MIPEMNSAEEKTSLEQASALVNSALSSSYSVRSFTGKWQPIRDKLEHLHSCLSSASSNGDSLSNSSLTKLLQAISTTAKDTEFLAQSCSDDSYNGGKLLMKSDLDVVNVKLELHIKHLNEIYASGVLMNSRAIILSKPGNGASREDMRFYVKDLFSRLRIGDMEMRARALAALNEVLQEDEKYVRIVVAETIDGLSILVNLLELREVIIQEEVSEVVAAIAGFDSCKGILVTAGVIPPLIQILLWGSALAKEMAAKALKQLTENCNNAWLVSSQGGITALLKICSEDGSPSSIIRLACGVLRNITGVGEIKRFMVEEGAISVLLKLLKSKEELSQIQAIELLYKLGSEDEIIRQKAARQEIVDSLLAVMSPNSLYSSKVREITLRAIEKFCFSSISAVKYLLNSGFLDRLLFLLKHGEILDQESALKTVSRFCGVSDEAKKAMGDMGFMPELVRMLEAKSVEVRETAADNLYTLILVQKNRRRFIQGEHNMDRILHMLNPEEGNSELQKLLLSVLISLTDSNSGRNMVATSGYVRNLEKFAETNMIEAKKILKRISTNKFRSILKGIWGS